MPSNSDICVALPLKEQLLYDALEPIDFPSPSADSMARNLICTSSEKIVQVKSSRERAAKIISEALTEAILNIFSTNDTEMGYKRK
jgi:hypothetical protein